MRILQVGQLIYDVSINKANSETLVIFSVEDTHGNKLFFKNIKVSMGLLETEGVLKLANASLNLPVYEQISRILGNEIGYIYKFLFDTINYESFKTDFFNGLERYINEEQINEEEEE